MRVSGELALADRYPSGGTEVRSLAARIERGPRISATVAVRIAAHCAEALHEIHRAGLAHGDVNPSNILLTRASGVQLVGRRSDAANAAYLAPERTHGAPATSASDIYSLGVVLYQMLSGRLPFDEAAREAMRTAHTAVAPEQLPEDVPPALVRLCLQMMAKNPGDRPASAVHVLGRLESPRLLDPWPARRQPRPTTASAHGWAAARRIPARDRAVTVTPGPLILLTAATAVALCLASAQRPVESGGGVHRVQTSVSATTSQPAGTTPPAAVSSPGVAHSSAPATTRH